MRSHDVELSVQTDSLAFDNGREILDDGGVLGVHEMMLWEMQNQKARSADIPSSAQQALPFSTYAAYSLFLAKPRLMDEGDPEMESDQLWQYGQMVGSMT